MTPKVPIGLEDLGNRYGGEAAGEQSTGMLSGCIIRYDIGVCVQIVSGGGGPGMTTKPNSQTLHCIKVMIHPA